MKTTVVDCSKNMEVIIKAAAPLDYRPKKVASKKIKKVSDIEQLDMVRTPDILYELGKSKNKTGYTLIGFAAETESLLSNAKDKLQKKNLDIIVANDVSQDGAGFAAETNIVKLIFRDGSIEELPLMPKYKIAEYILDKVKELRGLS